jgi:hypothetical protein
MAGIDSGDLAAIRARAEAAARLAWVEWDLNTALAQKVPALCNEIDCLRAEVAEEGRLHDENCMALGQEVNRLRAELEEAKRRPTLKTMRVPERPVELPEDDPPREHELTGEELERLAGLLENLRDYQRASLSWASAKEIRVLAPRVRAAAKARKP